MAPMVQKPASLQPCVNPMDEKKRERMKIKEMEKHLKNFIVPNLSKTFYAGGLSSGEQGIFFWLVFILTS